MTVMFLAAWALRSAVVVLTAAVLLALFRVKDPSLRLTAWTAKVGAVCAKVRPYGSVRGWPSAWSTATQGSRGFL
jgi:hypothetical protein